MTTATVIKDAPDASADAPTESHVGAVLGYVTPGPGKPAIDITPNGPVRRIRTGLNFPQP